MILPPFTSPTREDDQVGIDPMPTPQTRMASEPPEKPAPTGSTGKARKVVGAAVGIATLVWVAVTQCMNGG